MHPLLDGVPDDEPVDGGGLGLADPVHTADGLQLLRGVEDGLHQQDVAGLDQVEAVGARGDGQEEDFHVLTVLPKE